MISVQCGDEVRNGIFFLVARPILYPELQHNLHLLRGFFIQGADLVLHQKAANVRFNFVILHLEFIVLPLVNWSVQKASPEQIHFFSDPYGFIFYGSIIVGHIMNGTAADEESQEKYWEKERSFCLVLWGHLEALGFRKSMQITFIFP